ncbi:MAG: tetratricopeptide repeat protein [Gammaproteobacteria bacterium]
MNDHTQDDDKDFAAALALGKTGKNPELTERSAQYLDEQIALSKSRREQEHAHAEREAALHDLHAENLKLQSQALRAQHKQMRSQRLHDRLHSVYQGVLSLIALAILGVIIYAVVSAATDQSVVVNQFQVPPSFVAEGNSGTVVASAFLDQLQSLQAASQSSQAAKALQDAWSNNIQLQVPDVHVSLGDIGRTLHNWLGHEIKINGNVVQQGNQIILTVRGTNFAARTFSGNPVDLPKLLIGAAEYVYGQAEPYLFSVYLINQERVPESIALIKSVYPRASDKDRPWLLNGWGDALAVLNQNAAAVDKFAQALRLDPHFWIAYGNLQSTQIILGREEAAYQTGVHLEKTAHRGSWFAARMPGIYYQPIDYLRMDLPATHRDLLADEAAHGGQGSLTGQDAPLDAEMLARMHANTQAALILQTSPGAGSNPYVMAETAFVQGLMALDRHDYAQAATFLQTTDTLLTQNPDQGVNFLTPPVCYLGLAEEMAGHPNKADVAIAKGGHFVDCYRFKGDIADHRGDWAQAQQDYQAAVNLAPSLPQAYQSWGEALLRKKNYVNAIIKFQQANQRGPHWCDPLKYWGDALAAQGNYKQAIQKYAEASKYTPGWGALELAWGEALDKLGKHEQAMTHYQAAHDNNESLTATEQATLAKLLR